MSILAEEYERVKHERDALYLVRDEMADTIASQQAQIEELERKLAWANAEADSYHADAMHGNGGGDDG